MPSLVCAQCGGPLPEAPGTLHYVDTCAAHGTWFDGMELPQFIEAFAEARAGEISDEDARAAGLPGTETKPGGGGFFSDLFESLSALGSK